MYLALVVIFFLLNCVVFRLGPLNSFFLTLVFVLPIERGVRDWLIVAVPHEYAQDYFGYAYYFGISLKMVFLALIVLLQFHWPHSYRQQTWTLADISVLLFLLTAVLGSFNSNASGHAFLALTRIFSIVGLYFLARKNFPDYLPRTILYTLISVGVVQSLVGIGQMLTKHPLGLYIEDTATTISLNFTTTDGYIQFRSSGFFGHPTFFGSYLSIIFGINLGLLLDAIQKRFSLFLRLILSIDLIIITLAIFSTYSRSAWISITVIALIPLLTLAKNFKLQLFMSSFAIQITALLVALFLTTWTLFGISVVQRLASFERVLEIGNGKARLNLINYGWQLFQQQPVWGIGLNNFTPGLISLNPAHEDRYFVFPVHNTWILFFVEAGVFNGSLFIIIFILWFNQIIRAPLDPIEVGIVGSLISFVVNSQVHTLFTLDPSLEITFLLAGLLYTQVISKPTHDTNS